MFGKKKITQEDIDCLEQKLSNGTKLLDQWVEKREMLASDYEQIKESEKQMEVDIKQATTNIENVSEYAKQNSQSVAGLSHLVEECKSKMELAEKDYEELCRQIENNLDKCEEIVEENKHFTSPSKYLSEVPAELRGQNLAYRTSLAYMAEYGKQMSVMALNAAIEAGRMGDAGRSFVQRAEEIRNFSCKYEETAREVQKAIEASEEKVKQLEETVHHLVSLLKDNNVAMTKLMRQMQTTAKQVKGSDEIAFSKELTKVREELTGVRNIEEEIIKSEERNRMQMEDILAEVVRQQEAEKEISDELQNMYREIRTYKDSLI